jgi:serine protease inhibitor
VNYLKVINFYENAKNVKIKLGNKAFAYEGLNIKADYINVLTQLFKSGLERVNFADSTETADRINNYVDDVTDGLIDEIVQPSNFDADTRFQYFIKMPKIYPKSTEKNLLLQVSTF